VKAFNQIFNRNSESPKLHDDAVARYDLSGVAREYGGVLLALTGILLDGCVGVTPHFKFLEKVRGG
jgi:hypothetical protein